ncbi:MAG TPA: GNAT family N-acetyltransferase, partial [Longimicrobiales bacterium]|nr:GNAT family N-acetyltransferase [Longimicrobiales bacterium]
RNRVVTLREWVGRRLRAGLRFLEMNGAGSALAAPAPHSFLTERLGLVPATPASLRADLQGAAALAAVLGVAVPDGWPPDLYDRDAVLFVLEGMRRAPGTPNWWLYYAVRRGVAGVPPVVVGCVGYKGPPERGTLEIGYSILTQHRGQGYATEAASALTRAGFDDAGVRRVIAETLPTLAASRRVLQKCGFRRVPGASGPGILRYELSRARAAAESSRAGA